MSESQTDPRIDVLKAAVAPFINCDPERFGPLEKHWCASCGALNGKGSINSDSLRSALIIAAEFGILSAREAEKLSESLGYGPLIEEPDADEFNPLRKFDWTLPMALAWIAALDMRDVMEQDNDYRAAATSWRRVGRQKRPTDNTSTNYIVTDGSELVQRHRSALTYFLLGDCPSGLRPSDAKDRLWSKLRSGELSATGRPNGGTRQAIEAAQWQDLEPQLERTGSDVEVLEAREPDKPLLKPDVRWYNVTVKMKDVLRWWPAPKINFAWTIILEREAQSKLASILQDEAKISKQRAMAQLKQAFADLPTKAFLRMWPRARETAGLEAKAPSGRKRKSHP